MTLEELRLIKHLLFFYVNLQVNARTRALDIIEKEIRLKTLDPVKGTYSEKELKDAQS